MGTTSPALPRAEDPAAAKRAIPADCAVIMVCVPVFTIFVLGIALLLLTGNAPGHHDLISYWTAGHQLAHHANPYDRAAVLEAELAAGFPPQAQVLLVRNPPWALALVLPLGIFGVLVASLLWTLLQLGCFIASARMIGEMVRQPLGEPESRMHLLGYAFAPALMCVLNGQSSLFALLGLVLFLKLHRTRTYLAGSALYLCAIKPHLFLPFAAALFLWTAANRSYRLFFGFVTTLSAAMAVTMWFDPMVWSHYRQMMQTSGIANEFIACPAVALRFAIHREAIWLQYLPAALGCGWAVFYYAKHRANWDWMEHGAMLLVVSLMVSPYAWVTDQAILLPAVMLATAHWASPIHIRLLMLASALIEIQDLRGVTLHSPWVLWTAPFWLAWYLSVSAKGSASPSGAQSGAQSGESTLASA